MDIAVFFIWFILDLGRSLLPEKTEQHYDIVVVGGGVAGLSTALHLLNDDRINRIAIVEASDRIGGRVRTLRFNDTSFLELGAGWIHGGGPEHPVWKFAQENGLDVTIDNFDYSKVNFRDQRGNGIEVDKGLGVYELDELIDCSQTGSIGEAFYEAAQETGYVTDPLNQDLLQWRLEVEAADCAFDNINEASLISWCNFNEFDGEDYKFRQGYDQFITLMEQRLKASGRVDFHTNTPIESIEWSGDIISLHGSESDFQAPFSVVTVSVGVLQRGERPSFEPPLPMEKRDALKRIKMGTMNRIIMEFSSPFWNAGSPGFAIVHRGPKTEWFHHIPFFSTSDNNLVIGWIAGEAARTMERLDDEVIRRDVLGLIRNITGLESLPAVRRFIPTRWFSDENFLGSYSSVVADGRTDMPNKKLREPIGSRGNLLFAGEATMEKMFQTVHGAFLSGKVAALKIKNSFGEL